MKFDYDTIGLITIVICLLGISAGLMVLTWYGTTIGTITNASCTPIVGSTTQYVCHLTINYAVNNQLYQINLTTKDNIQYINGQQIGIEYSKSNPAIAYIKTNKRIIIGSNIISGAILVLVIGAILYMLDRFGFIQESIK